jgi:hypothetical protein
MKWLARCLLVIIAALVIPFLKITIDDSLFAILYTIIGIMFPLEIGQTMIFPFSEIKNTAFVKRYRSMLARVRNISIILFTIATIGILFKDKNFVLNKSILHFELKNLLISFILFCIFSFIRNFLKISQLKDEIDDKIRESKQKS